MNVFTFITRQMGWPLASCRNVFLIVDFIFSLVELGLKLACPVSETYPFTEER
jgi:hypothetical protein